MTMKRNGFVWFLLILRKKKQFRINMNSLYSEWEGPLYIPKGKVRSNLFVYLWKCYSSHQILLTLDCDWDHHKSEKLGFVQHKHPVPPSFTVSYINHVSTQKIVSMKVLLSVRNQNTKTCIYIPTHKYHQRELGEKDVEKKKNYITAKASQIDFCPSKQAQYVSNITQGRQ